MLVSTPSSIPSDAPPTYAWPGRGGHRPRGSRGGDFRRRRIWTPIEGRYPGADPGVAVRVSASPSKVSVQNLLKDLAAASGAGSGIVSGTIAKVEHGLGEHERFRPPSAVAGHLDLILARTQLPAPCNARAILPCASAPSLTTVRTGVRPKGCRSAVMAALRAGGFKRLALRGDSVHSAEETLARWRLDGDTLEVTTGWTKLGHCSVPPAEQRPGLRVTSDRQEIAQIF